MPEQTLRAFAGHGEEGVQSFCASYRELLDCIERKLRGLAPAGRGQ